MPRTRTVATVLALTTALVLVVAGPATSQPTLSTAPPVTLPGHRAPASTPPPPPPKPKAASPKPASPKRIPTTGMNVPLELLVAAALLFAGSYVRPRVWRLTRP